MTKFKLSQATVEDKDILVKHRLGMFHDMYPELAEEIQASEEPTREWIEEKLSDGSLIGFIVRNDAGQVAGSGCLWIKKEQPNPTRLRLEAPYLLSMFTEKRFRRKGLARLIVKAAIAWSQEHGYDRITLHATDVGKPLYEEFGFESSNEMKLKL
jgi:GNAT superfamily N-acetyltransferase